MVIREVLKKILPTAGLDLYRKIRSVNHYMFKEIKNKKSAEKYKSLILDRFPDLQHPVEDSVVLDLGANIGSFTHACVELGMAVRSVEPHPIAFKYLRTRTKKLPGVILYEMAVSDHCGSLKLFTHPLQKNDPITTSVSASLIVDKFGDDSGYYEVPTVTLDQFFADVIEFEIVKIDIEGAEMLLIDQLIENAGKIRRLLVETHERFMIESEMSELYQKQLNKLNDYITANKLEKVWLTDWI